MATVNPDTDALKLVETFPVPSGRWFLPPAVRNDVGYSLQIYSPTGQYIGEVTPGGVQQRAHEGDQVLRINLGLHPVEVKGTLNTRDGFTRAYSLTLTIQVATPATFGVLYRQSTDPVAQLRIGVDDRLRNWAETRGHDDITASTMREWAKTFANLESARLGFYVESVKQPSVELDPHYAEMLAKRRAEEQRQIDAENQARINAERRGEEAKDGAAAREQSELNAQSADKIRAHSRVTEAIVTGYIRRIDQALEDNVPISVVIGNDPDFAAWYRSYIASPGDAQASLPPPVVETVDAERSAPESARSIPALGVTLAPTTLTPEQFYFIEQSRLIVDQAYTVQRVDAQGTVTQPRLEVSDVIVQVEGQSIQSLETVTHVLSAATPTAPVRVRIIRRTAQGTTHFEAQALPQGAR